MKRFTLNAPSAIAIMVSISLTGGAAAQSFNVSCVKGDDARVIEVVTPGAVGDACDVRYTTGNAEVRTPYHANNSVGFCQTKASEIVGNLIGAGYACGQVGGTLTAEARSPEPAPAPEPEIGPEPETIPEPTPEPTNAPEPEADLTPANDTPEPELTTSDVEVSQTNFDSPVNEVAETVTGTNGDDAQTVPASDDMAVGPESAPVDSALPDESLIEPAQPGLATREPASLTTGTLETLDNAVQPTPAGRLVGAQPQEVAASQNTVEGSGAGTVAPSPPPVTPQATPATGDDAQAAPVNSPAPPKALRRPEDIVLATLNAQIAAWNEGNLNAFMDTYWNDNDLKLVSGTKVTKGWSSTMKQYRTRYTDESGLGRLSLEKTDAQMVTDDVAVVTGRFNHAGADSVSSGAFTLVFKRADGVWRIVHDHSVNDPAGG